MIVKECHVTAAFLFVFVLSCGADNSRVVTGENAAAKDSLSPASVTNPISSTPAGAAQSTNDPVVPTKKVSQISTPTSVAKNTVTPDVKPSTVKPDPDPTNPPPPTTKSTEPAPTTKPTPTPPTKPTTSIPTSSSEKPTTPKPPTHPPPSPSPSSSTTTPGSTSVPVTTSAPPHHRQFDAPSFFGGIILASGLTAIGFLSFKFYKARTERNYHTL